MLQIEALVQICSLAIFIIPEFSGKIVYLSSANNLKFIKKVIPNDKLDVHTKIISFSKGIAKCEGMAFVNNLKVCSANFILIQPDEFQKYIPQK